MFQCLRSHYDAHGLGALRFACRHHAACSAGSPKFTTAQEAFVGTAYEAGVLPRLLFVSLDSGSTDPDPTAKTLEARRRIIEAEDVRALPKGRHWHETHELACLILRGFKPTLSVDEVAPFFAYTTSAKCCANNPGRAQAADVLLANCRAFVPDEVRCLAPKILITQGDYARAVVSAFSVVRPIEGPQGSKDWQAAILQVAPDLQTFWFHSQHPDAYAQYWRQKNACWDRLAAAVIEFVDPGRRPVVRPVPQARPAAGSDPATPRTRTSTARRSAEPSPTRPVSPALSPAPTVAPARPKPPVIRRAASTDPNGPKAPVVHRIPMAIPTSGADELGMLVDAFQRLFGMTGRPFSTANGANRGISDDAQGVQWNAGLDRASGLAWLGLNLDGVEYDGWPIARLIEREVADPTLPTVCASLDGAGRVELTWTRDAWQGATRYEIRERQIGGTPMMLDRVTPQRWSDMLSEAGACLDAAHGNRGRGRQFVTRGGHRVELAVSPHLAFTYVLWRQPPATAADAERILRTAMATLEPVYTFIKERSA